MERGRKGHCRGLVVSSTGAVTPLPTLIFCFIPLLFPWWLLTPVPHAWPSLQSIFAIGDRVACIVTEMENDGTRVSISTKELEMYKGEMIEARDEVMKNADQRVRALSIPPPEP